MNRLAALAAGFALLFSTGCKTDSPWSVRKALGLDEPPSPATQALKELTPESLAVPQRVEELSRKIMVQNTFSGLDPDTPISTIGVKESVLFHRVTEIRTEQGTKRIDQVIISEGLVEKCHSDGELAAVLCAEFGQMVAEKRTAKSLARDVSPIPDANYGGSSVVGGGSPFDAGQLANVAYQEKKYPRSTTRPDPADATQTARDLLKGAGYSPAELDRVEALLKQSDRGEKLRKQMGGSAPDPVWQK